MQPNQQDGIKFGKEQLLANLAMLVVVILWGVSYISVKIAVDAIPPTTLALIRFAIAALFLWIIQRRVEPDARFDRKDIPKMLLGGLLGVTFYFYFQNIGVKLSTAVNASLIAGVVPIIAIILDVLFFHGRASWLKILAIVMTIIGAYMAVTANGQISTDSSKFTGNMYMLVAMMSWALYTLVNRSLQDKYSGIFLITYQMISGTLFLVPLSMFEYHEWRWFSLSVFGHVLFLSICCSVVCYVLYMYALKRLDVVITTIYLNLVTVVGVVSGCLILHETILPAQMIGGVITIVAIIAVNLEDILARKRASRTARDIATVAEELS